MILKTEPLCLRVLCKEWTSYFAASIILSENYNL